MEYVDIDKLSDEDFDFITDEAYEVFEFSDALISPHQTDKTVNKVLKTYLSDNYELNISVDAVYDELWSDYDLNEELDNINENKLEDCPNFFGFIQVQINSSNVENPTDSATLAAILFPICSYDIPLPKQLENSNHKIIVQWLPGRDLL